MNDEKSLEAQDDAAEALADVNGGGIAPESPAGAALAPDTAVDAEVHRREGAFGDSGDGDAPDIP